jgi:hypothetical protein
MTNMKPVADPFGGPPKLIGGELAYVDFIPAVLERDLAQSGRALKQEMATLRDLKLLIAEKSGALRTQRKVDGKNTGVIRINGDFFVGQ